MQRRKLVTEKDRLIWKLLQDPHFKVSANGQLLKRRCSSRAKSPGSSWRLAGWDCPSRKGTKVYRRVEYNGQHLYVHRIVWAATKGFLSPRKTINHKDLNGLNNHPSNLELISPAENMRHAKASYRRSGMSAAETRANWRNGANADINWRGQHGRYISVR